MDVPSLHNLAQEERAVLRYLFNRGPCSRSSVAKAHGYSKTKTNSIIADLVDVGLVFQEQQPLPTGGRSALPVGIHPDIGYVLGLDIGATSVNVAVADARCRILASAQAQLDVRAGPLPVLNTIVAEVEQLLEKAGIGVKQLVGVGAGVPAPVDASSRLLASPPLMPGWSGFSIPEYFCEKWKVQVAVDNDVNVMTLGELARRPDELLNAVLVKIGTGVGAGIVCRGEIYRGADGSAGHIGHICVDPDGPPCQCGNTGCLATLASGPAISRAAVAAAGRGESMRFEALLESQGAIAAEEVGTAGREGDLAANRIISESGQYLGQALAGLVNFFNPSHIIIGGGVSNIGHLFLSSVRQAVYKSSLPISTRHLLIEYSQAPDAGLLGCLVLAWHELLAARPGEGRGVILA